MFPGRMTALRRGPWAFLQICLPVLAVAGLTFGQSGPSVGKDDGDVFVRVRDAVTAEESSSSLEFREIRDLIDTASLRPGAIRHTFRARLPHCSDERAEAIWAALRLKAREPEHFVLVISSTEVVDESVPLGFIRVPVIDVPGRKPFTITEHVMLDDALKTVLFIQTDGDFLASNRIEKDGGDWHFVLHYVYDHPKAKDVFDEEMATVMYKLLAWADAELQKEK